LGIPQWLNLVGGLEDFLFSIIYGIILSIDSYFSEGLKPPTSNDLINFKAKLMMVMRSTFSSDGFGLVESFPH